MIRLSLDRFRPLRVLVGPVFLLVGVALGGMALKGEPELWFFAALASFGAAAMIGLRSFVEIDHERRVLSRRFGIFHAFSIARFDFASVRSIVLQTEYRKSYTRDRSSSSRTVHVLRVNGGDRDLLCELDEMWLARRMAERICREMQVQLENRLMSGFSSRKPGELDLPLAERWRRAGEHKEVPVVPTGSNLCVTHGDDFSEISTPVEPKRRVLIGLTGGAVLAALLIAFHFVGFSFLPILLILGGAAVFGTVGMILQHTGRNRVRFTADTVRFLRGKFSRRSIPLARIEELLENENENELVLMSDEEYLVIAQPQDPAEARIFRQFVERQIAQRQTHGTIAAP